MMNINKKYQHGFSLIGALIMITVLSGLGAFMVSLSGTQQINTTLKLQSSRAFYAAESGLAWAKANIQKRSGSLCTGNATSCCNTLTGQNFTVDNFQVNINSCVTSNHNETGNIYDSYAIEVTAKSLFEGESGFASKKVKGTFFEPPACETGC
jgi:MSHA biogenesis protein MshP